jgi:hypothetical protein
MHMEKRTGHETRKYERYAGVHKGSGSVGHGKIQPVSGRHPAIPENVMHLDLSKLKWKAGRTRAVAHGEAKPVSVINAPIPEDVVELDLSMLQWKVGGSRKGGLGKTGLITPRRGSIPEDAAQLDLDAQRDYERQFEFRFPSYQMEIANCLNDYLLPV